MESNGGTRRGGLSQRNVWNCATGAHHAHASLSHPSKGGDALPDVAASRHLQYMRPHSISVVASDDDGWFRLILGARRPSPGLSTALAWMSPAFNSPLALPSLPCASSSAAPTVQLLIRSGARLQGPSSHFLHTGLHAHMPVPLTLSLLPALITLHPRPPFALPPSLASRFLFFPSSTLFPLLVKLNPWPSRFSSHPLLEWTPRRQQSSFLVTCAGLAVRQRRTWLVAAIGVRAYFLLMEKTVRTEFYLYTTEHENSRPATQHKLVPYSNLRNRHHLGWSAIWFHSVAATGLGIVTLLPNIMILEHQQRQNWNSCWVTNC
jgi:hypothetical protein